MALKFLNKKGWHTGSLRNIENVWKAEQKHDAEQKKLEELRKQIHEERERSEFRQLQEAAGLVPRQERLDFLYESGLAVGKGSSDGFKVLQAQPSVGASSSVVDSNSSKAAVPGALFEDKPQSANDAWRKLHSDPLLLIRQREQEALARIKNNPVRMAMIQKSLESEKKKLEDRKEIHEKRRHKHKHLLSKSKGDIDVHRSQLDSEYSDDLKGERRRLHVADMQQHSSGQNKGDKRNRELGYKRKTDDMASRHEIDKAEPKKHSSKVRSDLKNTSEDDKSYDVLKSEYPKSSRRNRYSSSEALSASKYSGGFYENKRTIDASIAKHHNRDTDYKPDTGNRDAYSGKQKQDTGYNNRQGVPKMTEEEREARLREMQENAELHDEQRYKRLKRAAEADALETNQAGHVRGKSFLDATQKSVYGMDKGGSGTIEENVRRRTFYSQGHSAQESNAFRR